MLYVLSHAPQLLVLCRTCLNSIPRGKTPFLLPSLPCDGSRVSLIMNTVPTVPARETTHTTQCTAVSIVVRGLRIGSSREVVLPPCMTHGVSFPCRHPMPFLSRETNPPRKVAELEASDPSNAGFTKLRTDLEEVIRLTKGLVSRYLGQKPASQVGSAFCCQEYNRGGIIGVRVWLSSLGGIHSSRTREGGSLPGAWPTSVSCCLSVSNVED